MAFSLLHWLQTAGAAPGRRRRLAGPATCAPDVTGTEDGLAKYPYVRESRRIRAGSR